MHGGRLVARSLKAAGAQTVFGLCGDHINAIFEGCADEGVRLIDTRDERGAAHMAEGWSLATRQPGVAIVTGGPGFTNALTPMADALLAGTPMVVVTSRIRLAESGKGFPQDIDQMAFGRPLSVWSRTVFDVERIPATVAEAFAQARSRRGPAVVELPLDVQLARVADDGPAAAAADVLAAAADERALDAAAKILGESERPVIVAGEGAFWSGAGDALTALAEAARIPVFTVRAGRGIVPDGHELAFGLPNFLRPIGQEAFGRADALLVVGCELDIVLAFGMLAPQARLVRVEADPARVTRSRRPDVAIVADESAAVAGLARRLEARADAGWVRELRAVAEAADGETAADRQASGSPVHPARLAAEVAGALGPRGTVAIDAGELSLWAQEIVPATGPGRLLASFGTPLSTLGPGVPFAIAAKLARPDEPAIALVGDGALGFSVMELDTAARHGVDVLVVVGNDAAWGIVKRQMEMAFGRSVAADLTPRHYDMLAQALGVRGAHVDDAAGLGAALGRALSGPGPALVDVTLDRAPVHPAMQFVAAMFSPGREAT